MKKLQIVMTKGLPASGKTTYAKALIDKEPGKWKRVNKDDLRAMLDNSRWSKINEKFVLKMRDTIMSSALDGGWNVISDDTNLDSKHENTFRIMAKLKNAEFSIVDFTDVSVEECIKRDQKRSNYAGEKVIKEMYKRYLQKKEVVTYDPRLPDCVVCDLDGTLAFFDGSPYERDFRSDKVNKEVSEILSYYAGKGVKIIYTSGRTDKFKTETTEWLLSNSLLTSDMDIHMRVEGDVRKDSIVKKEMYDTYIRNKYNVLLVMDDRDQVVELWRSLGLKCFQVAEGDF